MGFHRLSVPSYFGGLPGGYNYINNALAGTPSAADGAKSGGPNSGTYFIAFGEDATSANANRPSLALAENCDYLDDLLHRDIAVTTRTGDVVAGAPVASIIITGPNIFLGPTGTPNTVAGIATVFHLLDENDEEIVNTGAECQITAIAGGIIGSNGFSAGSVTLTISPAIPTGKTYRVYYGTLSNLATLPVDAFTSLKIRGAEEVPGELIGYGGAGLIGYNGGPTWADTSTNPQTTVEAQLDKIISDLSLQVSGASNGANKIGSFATTGTWATTTALPTGTVWAQVNEIVRSLGSTSALEGSTQVGSPATAAGFSTPTVSAGQPPWSLTAGTTLSQLQTLLHAANSMFRVRSFTAAAALDNGGIRDAVITLDVTAGTFAIALTDPTLNKGRMIALMDENGLISPTVPVTLTRFGTEKINNVAASYQLIVPDGRWLLFCDGTNWYTFSG